MDNNEHPNAWDPNCSSESNLIIKLRRFEQSSSNSHLQYISTREVAACMLHEAHAGREEVHLNVVAIQVVMWKTNIAGVIVN